MPGGRRVLTFTAGRRITNMIGFLLAASLDALLRANAYPFTIADGKLSGPGATLIESRTEGVQFVALGEEHNRRGVHEFGAALFQYLAQNRGFQYLTLEEDPYICHLVSQAARRHGTAGVLDLARRYPNAFHMYTESEFDMIGRVAQLSTAPTDPIWGVNQVFGAMHIYQRLAEIAPDANARAIAQRLLDQSKEYEAERFQKNLLYMSAVAKLEDFNRLREAFHPVSGSEADFLIAQMTLSNQIFAPYVMKPPPSAEAFYESGERRERNMKMLFAGDIRKAQAAGVAQPKVLAMLGQLHLYRGLSERTEQYTFGNLLSELATFDGMKSLHIYATVNAPFVFQSKHAPLARAALDAMGEASGVAIDLRPLFQAARKDPEIDPEVRRLIMAFDFFVLLRDAAQPYEHLKTPNFRWYSSE